MLQFIVQQKQVFFCFFLFVIVIGKERFDKTVTRMACEAQKINSASVAKKKNKKDVDKAKQLVQAVLA